MWVVTRLPADHTGCMSVNAALTAFVTGAAGFLGRELVQVLLARGCRVLALARSSESAQRLRHAGATAVAGDLLVPGQWQDEAAADWVFHIAPCAAGGRPWKRAERPPHRRAAMDAHLLDAVASGATRRVVYVADVGWHTPTGSRPITEDELATGRSCGRTSALDRVEGHVIAGLPIVAALPGCVYGNGSWFREQVVDPVMAGRPVLQFGKPGPWVSPIHVHDCARALVHLAERGNVGHRYFIANSEPVQMPELAKTFARVANRRLRVWRVPALTSRFLAGRPLADYMRANSALSNIRLRGTGFRLRYSTIDQGMEQVLGDLDE
jgi:nucleoside-diphosphate-sugar epimerase